MWISGSDAKKPPCNLTGTLETFLLQCFLRFLVIITVRASPSITHADIDYATCVQYETAMFNTKSKVTELLSIAGITVNGDKEYDIQVRDERFYQAFLSHGRMGMGESYMDKWWDCQDLNMLFTRIFTAKSEIVAHVKTPEAILMALLGKLMPYGSKARSKHVGEFHYDLGNELYEAFLDPYLQYTCGYYQGGAATLNEAQEAKLARICQKLKLEKGQRLLDIGCGWGGLMKYAAEHYGIDVTGISISKEQLAYAEKNCQGLPATLKFQDYRDLNDQFDRITTVGMIEHVGKDYYREFFECVRRNIKPDGIFLLHTIGYNTSDFKNPWLQKYIFPGCYVPSIKQIGEAYEGLFVLEHVENIGFSYQQTLLHWYDNFEKAWPVLSQTYPQKYDERFYRMWRYYLLSCASGFGVRAIQLWQFVFSPNGVNGGYVFKG